MKEPDMTEVTKTFAELGLPEKMLKAIAAVGYETPSPIQAETIPPLLAGRDVLGQAHFQAFRKGQLFLRSHRHLNQL